MIENVGRGECGILCGFWEGKSANDYKKQCIAGDG